MTQRRVRGCGIQQFDLGQEELYKLANAIPRSCDDCDVNCTERRSGEACGVLSKWAQKRRKELSKLVPGDLSPMVDNLVWLEALTLSQRADGDMIQAKHTINLATSVARALHLAGRERPKVSSGGFDIFGREPWPGDEEKDESDWGDY